MIQMTKRTALMEGERILISKPKHWKNYILPVLTLSVTAALAIHCHRTISPDLMAGVLPAGAHDAQQAVRLIRLAVAGCAAVMIIMTLLAILDLAYTRYIITNRRIMMTCGFLRVKTSEMSLGRCETVSLTQNIYERIFRTGDLLIVTAGASIYMDDVQDVIHFRRIILNNLDTDKRTLGEY